MFDYLLEDADNGMATALELYGLGEDDVEFIKQMIAGQRVSVSPIDARRSNVGMATYSRFCNGSHLEMILIISSNLARGRAICEAIKENELSL